MADRLHVVKSFGDKSIFDYESRNGQKGAGSFVGAGDFSFVTPPAAPARFLIFPTR